MHGAAGKDHTLELGELGNLLWHLPRVKVFVLIEIDHLQVGEVGEGSGELAGKEVVGEVQHFEGRHRRQVGDFSGDVRVAEEELLQGGAIGDPLREAPIDVIAAEPKNVEIWEVGTDGTGQAAGEGPAGEVEGPNVAGVVAQDTRVVAAGNGGGQVPLGEGGAIEGLFHESEEVGLVWEVGLGREGEKGEVKEEEEVVVGRHGAVVVGGEKARFTTHH